MVAGDFQRRKQRFANFETLIRKGLFKSRRVMGGRSLVIGKGTIKVLLIDEICCCISFWRKEKLKLAVFGIVQAGEIYNKNTNKCGFRENNISFYLY